MKRMLVLLVLVVSAGIANASTINWGAQSGVALNADGGYAYLVYLGADGVSNIGGSSWNTGDDVVVASSFAAISGGYFSGLYNTAAGGESTTGAKYAIYVTSAGKSGTTLPTTGFYGVSQTFSLPALPASGDFYLTANVDAATAVPVPEPATATLALVGLGAMALRRRFQKKV